MKKTSKKVTLQTLDKKIDGITKTVGTLSDTVDSLARSTKVGFDHVDTFHTEMTDFNTDMTEFAKKTGMTLFNLDSHARETNRRLDALEKAGGPLTLAVQTMQQEIRTLNQRVDVLEKNMSK